jgi:hypothetical protein
LNFEVMRERGGWPELANGRLVRVANPARVRAVERNKLATAGWMAVVTVAGLVSRSRCGAFLPGFVKEYAGDTLWALLVFLLLGLLFPRGRTAVLAVAALAISFSVELSQLYQADWINQLRATRAGGLVLGRGWVATDLICYAVGIAMGAVGEGVLNIERRTLNIERRSEEK